ncbi:MAG: HIT family protein [Phycisphaerae bacterium]|nr:HIT family protein [Phycisphaerae bacterium]
MSHTAECIFCKIVAGEIPCLKVFEDDAVLAFLDIGPLADGHVLLIPKRHYERLDAMPADAASELMQHLPRLAAAVLAATGADAYNILVNIGPVAGQLVMHVHVHIIPRANGDGLGYRWSAKQYQGDRGKQLAGQIASRLA